MALQPFSFQRSLMLEMLHVTAHTQFTALSGFSHLEPSNEIHALLRDWMPSLINDVKSVVISYVVPMMCLGCGGLGLEIEHYCVEYYKPTAKVNEKCNYCTAFMNYPPAWRVVEDIRLDIENKFAPFNPEDGSLRVEHTHDSVQTMIIALTADFKGLEEKKRYPRFVDQDPSEQMYERSRIRRWANTVWEAVMGADSVEAIHTILERGLCDLITAQLERYGERPSITQVKWWLDSITPENPHNLQIVDITPPYPPS